MKLFRNRNFVLMLILLLSFSSVFIQASGSPYEADADPSSYIALPFSFDKALKPVQNVVHVASGLNKVLYTRSADTLASIISIRNSITKATAKLLPVTQLIFLLHKVLRI